MIGSIVTTCAALVVNAVISVPTLSPLPHANVVESFDGGSLPPNMVQNNVEAVVVSHGEGYAVQVHFRKVDWPNVYFTAPEGTWNWSAFAGIAVDIYNSESDPVSVCMRVDNKGADGVNFCNTATAIAYPGERTALQVRFNTGDVGPFWGMRGIPVVGHVGHGSTIDPSRITAFQVFLPRPRTAHTLVLDDVRLFGQGGSLEKLVPLPFVDRFGQYKHANWPGKLKDEQDLEMRRRAEEESLKAAEGFPGRDRFGGWVDGPQLEATGWFRTQNVDGTWWFVTPEGRLFFSVGIDCVATWERTFIEGRETWFDWLPDKDGQYAELIGYASSTHSMAEKIGGKGRTLSFYCANLIRKYGDEWKTAWRDTAYARMRSWGFNTIGNWSQADVLAHSRVPFVATANINGDFRRIEGAKGYWGRMPDVFDPRFADAVEASVADPAKRYGATRLCLGYFVDNELSWETIRAGTLASPADQPCRVALIERLENKYGAIEKLNDAWGTRAKGWNDLRVPGNVSTYCAKDLDDFVYAFARHYFDTVKRSLRRHAPNQLYLGCRLSSAPPPVVRACADVADVVSFNLYQPSIRGEEWVGENDIGKPVIIGEFHFGALDRGMFHTGLVATRDQKERAESYIRYVRSVADCPSFVGCHWFQYVDEPITGRFFDGENYNIGFVTVVDSPYPELVAAAKKVHAELYERRWHKSQRYAVRSVPSKDSIDPGEFYCPRDAVACGEE
jgi:hypothetical protein